MSATQWTLLRPLLNVTRAELRHYADTLRIPYVDDPTNEDPRFDRSRARAALAALAPTGIDVGTLTRTAERMARAREALEVRAAEALRSVLVDVRSVREAVGDVWIDRDGFAALERDTAMRVLARALQHVASAPHRPRAAALEAALDRINGGGTVTLHGAMAVSKGPTLYVFREPKALERVSSPVGSEHVFDERWLIYGNDIRGLDVRMLGEAGLEQLPDRPETPAPRAALAAKPAIWDGDRLVACRPLGFGPAYVIEDQALVRLFAYDAVNKGVSR